MGKSNKSRRVLDGPPKKQLPGKAVMYQGLCGVYTNCPTCRKKVSKAIMWEDNSILYCRRGCIPKKAEAEV